MTTVNDVGYVDEEGYLYLTDRKTFMIISGGVNVYPQETENLLITHPKVADAAVFGVPNPDLGEEVKAVVSRSPGSSPTRRSRGAARLLPGPPRPPQGAALDRLRGGAAPPPHRQALQARAARPLLGGRRQPHRLSVQPHPGLGGGRR
jgi:hypothetical protein